jgi:opacity protein-like surface antigen
MTMKNMHLLFFAAMLWILAVVPGVASASNYEITPIFGYTFGGEFQDSVTGTTLDVKDNPNYGIILDINTTPDAQIELYYSVQPTQLKADNGLFTGNPQFDLDIHYIHLGGTYGVGTEKLKPYVVASVGATYMDPKGTGHNSETRFSMSLGGGVKYFLTEHIGLRLEGRGFGTVFGDSAAAFCANGACAIALKGDLFLQFIVNAGVIIAF